MEKKNALEKIKELASKFLSVEETVEEVIEEAVEMTEEVVEEVELADVTTKDGVVLSINEDGSVMIGEEVAPDGEYILEDDSVLTVKDGMKVEEEVIEEEVATEEVETAEEEVIENEEEVVEGDDLTKRVEDLENALAELLGMFNSNKEEVESKMSKISNEPAEEEVKVEKTSMNSKKEKELSMLEKYAKARNNK